MSNQLNDPMPLPPQMPPTGPQPRTPPFAPPQAVLRLAPPAALRRGTPDAPAGIPARVLDSAVGPLALRLWTPADAADAAAHADFLLGLGEHGRRMRRFALPRAAAAGAGRGAALTLVLADTAADFPAPGPGRILGELCVCIDARGVAAEFALAVRADLQGRGLGRILAAALLDLCRVRRVVLVCASVPSASVPMLALARSCGFQVLRAADGSAQLALMLRPRGVR